VREQEKFIGNVQAISSSAERAGRYARTRYVAAIAINKIEKGTGLMPGELV
jgi:hypothetical protein